MRGIRSLTLGSIDQADYEARLLDFPPPMTWKQFHDRARLGWRLVRAIELRSGSVVMIDDVVGVVPMISLRQWYPWGGMPPTGEMSLTIEALDRGYLLHYEAHLSPERSVLVYEGTPIYYPT